MRIAKVLVANRGEIAVRVIRACREQSIASVAVFSEADREALHVQMADEAYPIGPPAPNESYLAIDKLVRVAKAAGADAVHPGYGFLAENAAFAEACVAAGLVFIGPPPQAIRALGDKTAARRIARELGVPTVAGTFEPVAGEAAVRAAARQIGYPLMIKASMGGGGKGMRAVHAEGELVAALGLAQREASYSFGDGAVYLERLLLEPRHIEVQVLADAHGHVVHLGERECSIQRRHQKLVEESPSPFVDAAMRGQLGEAACRIAKAAGYVNAGTVEFLVDADRNFYFLEMNTRLQVEHPVTELVTGVDLVKLQIRIAAGQPLGFAQEDVVWRGSAIECRVYAEDPDENFFPSPGTITRLAEPSGPGIRLDSGVYEGFAVPIDYDPLLAKLAAWAGTRGEAIARMSRALGEYHVAGIRTNLAFFRRLLDDPVFGEGLLDTGFIGAFLARSAPPHDDPELAAIAALVAAIHARPQKPDAPATPATSRWGAEGREQLLR